MASGGLMEMIGPLLGSVPLAVAMLIGLAMAVARHGRHPRVSLFAAIGFAIGLLMVVSGLAFNAWIRRAAADGNAMASFGSLMIGYNVLHAVLSTASWGFLIAAVFCDRPAPPPAPRA